MNYVLQIFQMYFLKWKMHAPKATCLIAHDDEIEGVIFCSGHVMKEQKIAEWGAVLTWFLSIGMGE